MSESVTLKMVFILVKNSFSPKYVVTAVLRSPHVIYFQESFFIDSNSPNTAYTKQDFCSIQDHKRISLSHSLFLPDFSSSYRLRTLLSFLPFPISALRGFTSGCVRFVLLESNRIEYHGGTTSEYGTALRFLLPILLFS